MIENIEEMVKDNHATEASRALRDAAEEIQKSSRDLQDKLDALRYRMTISRKTLVNHKDFFFFKNIQNLCTVFSGSNWHHER